MNTDLYNKCVNADFKKILEDKGYVYFNKGVYNLNIIGVRSNETHCNNSFNDILVLKYINERFKESTSIFSITTTPGAITLVKPVNIKGTSILVPGQYRGCWTIGKHQRKYEALVQCKPVKVYRDNNKDKIFDTNPQTIDEGVFGINIHKAGKHSTQVDNWSAGCQVFQDADSFKMFMTLCKKQIEHGFGNKFTYTLLNEKDLG